jgi:hypothetical protein
MNPVDPSKALDTIASQGVLGAIIVILLIAVGFLSWWLVSSFKERIAENKVMLEDKYKDAEQTRQVLRELKGSIDINTTAMNTMVAVVQAKG